MTQPRIIDDEDGVAGQEVRRYLERETELARRLAEAGLAVVVFAPDISYDERLVYFPHVQAALDVAVAKHGRALYVASVRAGPRLMAPGAWPAIDGRPGAFVGYFAVGEGGAVFRQPSGERGAQPALFHAAIGAMMTAYR